MLGISDAAEGIGFRTVSYRSFRPTWAQLRTVVPLPCIVHWYQRYSLDANNERTIMERLDRLFCFGPASREQIREPSHEEENRA